MNKKILIYIFLFINSFWLIANDWRTAMDNYNSAIQNADYKTAITYAYQSLEFAITEFGTNTEYYANSLSKLGEAYFLINNYDSSLKYYIAQINLLKAISKDTTNNYAFSCNNVSVIYQYQGKISEALPYLKESLEIKKIIIGEMDTSYAKSLHNLGNIYKQLVDFDQAEKTYVRALELKKALFGENNTSYAITAYNLGLIYKELGNYQKAKGLLEDCANIYKSKLGSKSKDYIKTIVELADVYIKLGDTKLAEKIIEENLGNEDNNGVEQADMIFTKAMLKYNNQEYAESEKLFQKSKSLIESTVGKGSPLYASCVNNLGVISWRLNKKDEAYKYFMEAIYIREKLLGKSNPDYATSVHNLAGLLKDIGKTNEADKYYKEAFDLYLHQIKIFFPFLSDNEKEKFYGKLRNRLALFNCYAVERMKTKPDIISEIYDYQIATKALLLNNSINVRKKILESGNEELIVTYKKWKQVREDLAKLYKLKKSEHSTTKDIIDSLDFIANNLEKELSRNPYFNKEYSKPKVSWQQIQRTLKNDEASVEIIRFRFKYNVDIESDTIIYIALILTKETINKPEIVVMYNGFEMENLYINGYQNAILLELDDTHSYSYFWEKIDSKIGDKKRIYVSQDGIYNKINLNTLKCPDGKYLIDKNDIIIVSNTADLINRNNIKSETTNLKTILIGYPKFLVSDNTNESNKTLIYIPELPGTKIEIESIKNILDQKKWNAELVLEEKANKPLFSHLSGYNLIHIATHGYFQDDIDLTKYDNLFGVDIEAASKNSLLRSGLVFSGAENTINNLPLNKEIFDNGFLYANDVMNLDLENAQLVVLSACQTGLGEEKNGDGVYGLQRAFLVAGAKSIIMSLWKVNDNTTQELMLLFYKHWTKGTNIFDAFKKAEIELRDIYPHPFYWGAFIVIGNIN